MTKISPKPADRNITNGHNETNGNSNASGFFKSAFSSPASELTTINPQRQPLNGKAQAPRQRLQGMKNLSWWQRSSLRTKATLAAIALGVLPVLAVGTIAYQAADKQLVKQIQIDKLNSANSLDNEVSRFIFERYGDVQVLANLPILRNSQVSKIVALPDKEAVLDNFAKVYGVYDSIASYDLNGNLVIASQGQNKASANIKGRDYFEAVLKTDRPFVGNPDVSRVTGKAVIFFAAPIKDSVTGKTIGVVRTRMPVTALEKVVQSYGNDSEEFLLVGPSGKVFAAKHAENLGKDAKALYASYPKFVAANKPSVQLETNLLDNTEHLFGYSPFTKIEGLPKLEWSSIITQPSKDAYAPQYLLLWTLGIGTALTALLVSALAAYLTNRATRPLLDLLHE